MTPDQVALIRETWGKVVPIADTAATIFYNRLFDLDPALRPLFAHSDMAEQRKKLTQMLAVAVANLDKGEVLVPAVEALGRRHGGYGVSDQMYDTVGSALLWTLEQGLGPAFTPAARNAWTEAYVTLAGLMKNAVQRDGAIPRSGATV